MSGAVWVQEGHSTVTATLDVLDNIYWGMDRGSASGLVFLDLRKAFDTVDHGILLRKLCNMNVSPDSVNWFRAYLCGRQQSPKVNGKISKSGNINCGIPQGSILGPLLFIIYMNDICGVLNFSNISLYADDTVI